MITWLLGTLNGWTWGPIVYGIVSDLCAMYSLLVAIEYMRGRI